MKITVSKSLFEHNISNFQPFLDKKDSSQITSHIYLESIDNKLLMKATDYEMGIETKIDIINSSKDGNATVNGKKILDILKPLKDEDIELECKEDYLLIRQNKSKFKIPMFNAEEFPQFPQFKDNLKIEIDGQKIINSIKKVNPTIETNSLKFELGGMFLDIKEGFFNFVGTDTNRLIVVQYKSQSLSTLSLLIPKRAIVEIQKLFNNNFDIYYGEQNIVIKSNSYIFFTKLISAKFPDYERIIPKSFIKELKFPKDKFLESIKMISSLSPEIKITISPKEVIFEAISDDNTEAKTQIDFDSSIDSDIVFGARSKNIIDFLSHNDSSDFYICMNDANKPFVLKGEDKGDYNFFTLVMTSSKV